MRKSDLVAAIREARGAAIAASAARRREGRGRTPTYAPAGDTADRRATRAAPPTPRRASRRAARSAGTRGGYGPRQRVSVAPGEGRRKTRLKAEPKA